jgi:hypothetical protein
MKIKKKEYYKNLNDSYWDGVNTGMKFALNNPEEARKYVDRSEALRKIVETATEAIKPLANAINNLFKK